MVMRVGIENRGYFCTVSRCRPYWIYPEWTFEIPLSEVSQRTSLINVKTIGKCPVELLMIKHISPTVTGTRIQQTCVFSKGVDQTSPNLAMT